MRAVYSLTVEGGSLTFALRTLCFGNSGSRLDEAKRWYEVAMSACRFVPGGSAQAEKVGCFLSLFSVMLGSLLTRVLVPDLGKL